MSKVNENPKAPNLNDLAHRIKASIRDAEKAQRSWLEYARETGNLLWQAREGVPHGEWKGWVKEHCELSPRVAQRYMKIADGYSKLKNAAADLTDLSLRRAEAIITDAKDGGTAAQGPKLIVVSAAEWKALRSETAPRPKLPPESKERKFVEGEVERIRQRVLGLANRTKLKVKGEPASPAAAAAAMIDAIKDGVALEAVVRAKKPVASPARKKKTVKAASKTGNANGRHVGKLGPHKGRSR